MSDEPATAGTYSVACFFAAKRLMSAHESRARYESNLTSFCRVGVFQFSAGRSMPVMSDPVTVRRGRVALGSNYKKILRLSYDVIITYDNLSQTCDKVKTFLITKASYDNLTRNFQLYRKFDLRLS